MATQSAMIRVPRRAEEPSARERTAHAMLLGAPVAAALAGIAAEWLDFRALRFPLLLTVGSGVLLTTIAMLHGRRGWRAAAATVLLGAATWGAAETLYALLHIVTGQRFDAPRFGPQPAQALGLIGVHAVFLGLPTGAVAAALLHARALARR